MKLEGKVFRGNLLLQVSEVEREQGSQSFTKCLEQCLVALCRSLEIPIPLWLEKNTKEFARFHQTLFFDGQFTEPVKFDRFQIRWLE
jgi:hypothetical protein